MIAIAICSLMADVIALLEVDEAGEGVLVVDSLLLELCPWLEGWEPRGVGVGLRVA